MTATQYDPETMDLFRKRWSLQTINDIVIALNSGDDIEPIFDVMKPVPGIPPTNFDLDLRGIDLSHQNLRGPWKTFGDVRRRVGVKLRKADLTGANLAWVILPWADLTGSCLADADLGNAELIYANLSQTDLTNANLQDAWFCRTRLSESNVTDDQLNSRRNLGQLDFDYYAYIFH